MSYASEKIRPYRVEIPQPDLEDLAERLGRTRWPSVLPGAAWERGVPVSYLRDLAAYWRDRFDWRASTPPLHSTWLSRHCPEPGSPGRSPSQDGAAARSRPPSPS